MRRADIVRKGEYNVYGKGSLPWDCDKDQINIYNYEYAASVFTDVLSCMSGAKCV